MSCKSFCLSFELFSQFWPKNPSWQKHCLVAWSSGVVESMSMHWPPFWQSESLSHSFLYWQANPWYFGIQSQDPLSVLKIPFPEQRNMEDEASAASVSFAADGSTMSISAQDQNMNLLLPKSLACLNKRTVQPLHLRSLGKVTVYL